MARVRRWTRIRKIGHAGTLDPMASGVLVLCLGPATRLSEFAMRSPKQYRATVRLGITTNTYDSEGEIVAQQPLGEISAADIEAVLPRFTGEIDQVPPVYSAIKQGGKRLYDKARDGEAVTLMPRRVTIERITMTEVALPDVVLDVVCSPGTYIRSLAYDIGEALGIGAYLAGLVRVSSGHFRVDEAVTLADFEAATQSGDWRKYLLPPETAVSGAVMIHLDAQQVQRVQHGNPVDAPEGACGLACAFAPGGTLLAVMEAQGDQWQPVKVFAG